MASFEQRFGAAEQELRTGQTNAPRPLAVATAEAVEETFLEQMMDIVPAVCANDESNAPPTSRRPASIIAC